MRFFKYLTLVIFFCVLVSNRINAKILWERELVPDANTNSTPFASCLNKNGDGIFVMTIESPKGSLPLLGGNCVLWEIGADGNAIRTLLKDNTGTKVQTKGPVHSVISSDNSGNILTVGILDRQKGEKGQKIGVLSKAEKGKEIISPRNSISSDSIEKIIPLQDDTFTFVGIKDGNGLYMRINSQGGTIQEKLFDLGQSEVFADADRLKSDNTSLVVAGTSGDLSKAYSKNFVLIYDANDKIISEDYFIGKYPPLLLPKVCSLDNGDIIAVYTKAGADPNKTLLTARCYTNKLKLLWEKEILSTNRIFTFDVISYHSGFIVAAALNNLEFHSFSEDGTKIDYMQYSKDMIGIPGFNLMHLNSKVITVFEENTPGNIKKCSIKAKVIALD
jgi:hypothetical protein